MLSHQARWTSKKQSETLRKTGCLKQAILLSTLKGYIVVEPTRSPLGDGEVLSHQEADYEVRPEWCLDAKKKIDEARKLLGLTNP